MTSKQQFHPKFESFAGQLGSLVSQRLNCYIKQFFNGRSNEFINNFILFSAYCDDYTQFRTDLMSQSHRLNKVLSCDSKLIEVISLALTKDFNIAPTLIIDMDQIIGAYTGDHIFLEVNGNNISVACQESINIIKNCDPEFWDKALVLLS
jgi:hypothetical protein